MRRLLMVVAVVGLVASACSSSSTAGLQPSSARSLTPAAWINPHAAMQPLRPMGKKQRGLPSCWESWVITNCWRKSVAVVKA